MTGYLLGEKEGVNLERFTRDVGVGREWGKREDEKKGYELMERKGKEFTKSF